MNRPTGFHSVTPYIMVKDTRTFIKFCEEVFGAKQGVFETEEGGRVRHAQILIGDSNLMISDETPAFPDMQGVESMGGSPISFFLYLDDADAVMAKALAIGATVTYPMGDRPYGRSGSFTDPFGFVWHVTTHKSEG